MTPTELWVRLTACAVSVVVSGLCLWWFHRRLRRDREAWLIREIAEGRGPPPPVSPDPAELRRAVSRPDGRAGVARRLAVVLVAALLGGGLYAGHREASAMASAARAAGLGDEAMTLGRHEQALEHFTVAAKGARGTARREALAKCAYCLYLLRKFDETLQACDKLEPSWPGRANHIRGLVYLAIGNADAGREYLTLAVIDGELAATVRLRRLAKERT